MRIVNGYDNKGCFYQYGIRGNKYYYDPQYEKTRLIARSRAILEGYSIIKPKQTKGDLFKEYLKTIH